jgi:hypothetical protein
LIYLVASRPPFGGLRWWFVCPRSRRRVRMLHLPLGAHRFACRRAYRLAYVSHRGAAIATLCAVMPATAKTST